MINTDELIEAISYAEDSGEDWWEVFDSISDAEDLLDRAEEEEPDEYQVVRLTDLLDEDIFDSNPSRAFYNCIKQLRKQLRKASK